MTYNNENAMMETKKDFILPAMKVRGDRMHDIAKRERMTFRQINQALERCYPTVISVLWG